MSNLNTPYDDSFRTLLTDCKRLVIPLVNELFHESHSEDAEVWLFQNECFINSGNTKKRITDSNFSISDKRKRYNIECQTNKDGSIVIRIFEYATQIAISESDYCYNEATFQLPTSGIIYLRKAELEVKDYTITIKTPDNQKISYRVPVIHMQDYTLEEILTKKLWMLIPFYFFNFDLKEMEQSEDKIREMQNLYKNLWSKLEEYTAGGLITEFEKCALKAMCAKVSEALSEHYDKVRKGVETVMGGQVLDYEAKQILNQGKMQGKMQGELECIGKLIRKKIEKGYTLEEAANILDIDLSEAAIALNSLSGTGE